MSTIEEGESVTVEAQQMKDKIKSLQERLLPRILGIAGRRGGTGLSLSCSYVNTTLKGASAFSVFFFLSFFFCFYCVSVCSGSSGAERVDYHRRLDLPKRRLLWVIINLSSYIRI